MISDSQFNPMDNQLESVQFLTRCGSKIWIPATSPSTRLSWARLTQARRGSSEPALWPFLRQIRLHRAHLLDFRIQQDAVPLRRERPRLYVIICEQHEVEAWLKVVSTFLEGTNTLIVLDDCAASKDVKSRMGELVKLSFTACHAGLSVWLLTQQLSSIAKPFRENVAGIELFYTPLAKTTKAIFEEYAGELSQEELKQLIARLKERKFAHLVFALCHPFRIELK